MWLRHAPAPLLWIHPVAKNHVLMPKGDSNVIFYSRCIFIVGTCPPMKMDTNYFLDSQVRRFGGAFLTFYAQKVENQEEIVCPNFGRVGRPRP